MDKYYTYRPMIDLIGKSEGTAPPKGRGYNETLGYGAYTGGDVELVKMTLDEIDELQTRMLRHPKNKLRSSALGWPQIIRTTLRDIRQKLGFTGKELFNEEMQERLTCYLLGVRGIDKWLAGRLHIDTLLTNLSQEWASLPKPDGRGYYDGQRASVTVEEVKRALSQVKARHDDQNPPIEIVPPRVEEEVKKKTGLWQWLTGLVGGGGLGLSWFAGMNWDALIAFGVVILVMLLVILLLRRQIVAAIKEIREGLE